MAASASRVPNLDTEVLVFSLDFQQVPPVLENPNVPHPPKTIKDWYMHNTGLYGLYREYVGVNFSRKMEDEMGAKKRFRLHGNSNLRILSQIGTE